MGVLAAATENFARYLPAVQPGFVEYVVMPPTREGLPISPSDLNFQDPDSRLWTYPHSLANAVNLMDRRRPNSITHRKPGSWVLGDSGGYQVGTGALKGFKLATGGGHVAELWRSSTLTKRVLRWLELNCDYGMTLDLPLWVKVPKYANKSPFHYCSVELLTDLTVENLRFFSDNRDGSCSLLNVLHGRTDAEEAYWFSRVAEFDFEGWAIGGSVGGVLDLGRLLRRLLVLRDLKMLGGRKAWLHVLGVGALNWAVALTAIQRAVQRSLREGFNVSFDTSTPFTEAAKRDRVYRAPILTNDLSSWGLLSDEFPTGYAAAVRDAHHPFPAGSPVSAALTLGDMNPRKGSFEKRTFDAFSLNALINHNCYVQLAAVGAANRAAFVTGPVPQPLATCWG